MKKFPKILPIFIFSLFLISCETRRTSDSVSFTAMDTFMTIKSFGKNAKIANRLAKNKVLEIEKLISVTNRESEIFFLNKNQQKWNFVSDLTFEAINFSKKAAEQTNGAFNPCLYPILKEWGFTTEEFKIPTQTLIDQLLPLTDFKNLQTQTREGKNAVFLPEKMEIDLGGMGKGFAGDKVLEILRQNGIKSAILDFGGNIQTLGKKLDGNLWTIGIKNPLEKEIAASVKVENKAVITSGGYERFFTDENGKKYIHILDSATGKPVDNETASVTIICENGAYADALSTALFAMGPEKAKIFWQNNKNFEMLIFTKNDAPVYTDGLADKIIFPPQNPQNPK